MSSNHDSKKTDESRPSMQEATPKIIRFEELTHCGNEVWIRNGTQLYRLQQTRQGKLILTK